jgi:hypothetical protein
MDRHFGTSSYSLKSLFKDEQRQILDRILSHTHEDLESRFRLITERYTPLMRFLEDLGAPLPPALQTAADFVLSAEICRLFGTEHVDAERLNGLIHEARARNVDVFNADLSYVIKNNMERLIQSVATNPEDVSAIKSLESVARLVRPLPLILNLWKVQNLYYETMQGVMPWYQRKAAEGDEAARTWLHHFAGLGRELNFAIHNMEL